MGEIDGWSEPNGLFLNGLLPGAESVIRSLNQDRLLKAEERIAELIACIQPNQPSEERRNAVADYVQRLITKCFPCQVFTFGSVPLKTYLPDGDIDVTAFSNNLNLKDTWANQVRDMLETEEKNDLAEFCVKEVQYIQAEVKIIKCLVENIVVDISFNQLGGLCTLCFLEEVDHLINQNHLFKRSIILIKAWCYYESRILGAPHGLISTYALETLVLYIFHVFNNSFTGPLEVLYRFLEFFGNFDWDDFCVSLWGPVPISSLPDVTVEPPRKDGGNLLLSKLFLDACSSVYAVFPSGQENQGQPFVSKHFNVIDPLRVNNNLGRSVSKGNFYRIRSAFAFGAKTLARLLEGPKENIISEVNQFFTTTWERHGSGQRPDAPRTNTLDSKLSTTSDHPSESDGFMKKQVGKSDCIQGMSRKNDLSTSSLSENHTRVFRQTTNRGAHVHGNNGRFMFARTNSSPELMDSYNDLSSRARRHRPQEGVQTRTTSIRLDGNNKKNSYHRGEPGSDAVNQELISSTIGGTQEEQDLVNMMGSTSLHHFNGQIPFPYNSPSPHSPFPIPPSFLASLRYTQQNMPTLAPLNVSNLQYPHGFVPQPLANHIPGIGLNSNLEHSSEKSNENFGSMEVNSAEPENGFGQDHEVGSLSGGFETENSNRDMFPSQNGYGSTSEKHGNSQRGHLDDNEFQDDIGTVVYYEERTTSSRFPSASYSNSQRSSTPESSSDGSTERRGKIVVKELLDDDRYGKGKIMSEHELNQVVNYDHVWNAQSNKGAEIVGAQSVDLLHQGSTRGSEPTLPVAQMFVGSDSWSRENPNLVPFYPTGPPVPFLMLPVYDNLSETGASDNDTSQNLDSTSDEQRSDILSSDFASHFQNLQYGRFCQNPPHPGQMFYQTPFMVPPEYLQGRIPWDNSSHGRPHPTNSNLLTQLMGYGSRVVPVPPLSPVSSRPPNVYQPFAGDVPKHRSGTGTYFPNPKISVRDRQPSNARRGNYNYDRNDSHGGDRDANWNMNSKPRASSRAYNRTQTEKLSVSRYDRLSSNENRADRSWEPNRNESSSSFHSQNGLLRANSSISVGGPSNVAYGLYHSNGNNVSPVLMGYTFEHDACSGLLGGGAGEQLEFGSLGPIGGVGCVNDSPHTNDGTQARGEHRSREASSQRPSSGQPSSPHHCRRS